MPVSHPADLTAREAARLIAQKELSPVEMAKASIERVETLNPAINAVVAQDFDRLLDEARVAEAKVMAGEALGPLHGLTFGVKDMIDVTGLPTTFGSEIFRDNIAVKDDAIVAAMRAAGAMPLGKTNNPDWSAGGNSINKVYGVTGNPHDLTKSAAGSSGGSAALLAARMAPLATGSDTGGSLRNPASFCGVVGYRPSPGVVPGDTRAIGLFHLSTSGPMARNVADVGLMLSVMARPDYLDPLTTMIDGKTLWNAADFADVRPLDLKKPRVAFTEDFGFAPTEGVVREPSARSLHASFRISAPPTSNTRHLTMPTGSSRSCGPSPLSGTAGISKRMRARLVPTSRRMSRRHLPMACRTSTTPLPPRRLTIDAGSVSTTIGISYSARR